MKFLLPVIVIVILIVGYFGLKQVTKEKSIIPSEKTSSPISANQELKTFQSKLMKFSVEFPNNFSANDEPSRITISGKGGEIYVNRSGTQFNNLDAYLANFDQTTQLELSLDQERTINNYEARERISKNPDIGIEKTYFIYVDNFIYKISTMTESLYDDLDQIAQSFRYTP